MTFLDTTLCNEVSFWLLIRWVKYHHLCEKACLLYVYMKNQTFFWYNIRLCTLVSQYNSVHKGLTLLLRKCVVLKELIVFVQFTKGLSWSWLNLEFFPVCRRNSLSYILLAPLALIPVHSTCTGLTCVGLSRTSLKCASTSKRGGAFSTYYPYPLLYCL